MKAGELQRAIRERRRVLGQASREFAHDVSVESDRWFLSSLGALDRGVAWTEHRIINFVRRVVWRRQKPRDRFRELLHSEAKRARLAVPQDEFRLFADRMSTLIELVLSGAVPIDNIVFEGDRPRAAGDEPQRAQEIAGA
jgi:hypothetical protein